MSTLRSTHDPLLDALARRWPTLSFRVHARTSFDDALRIDVCTPAGLLGQVHASADELLDGFNVADAIERLLSEPER